jgi:hypothetical protein
LEYGKTIGQIALQFLGSFYFGLLGGIMMKNTVFILVAVFFEIAFGQMGGFGIGRGAARTGRDGKKQKKNQQEFLDHWRKALTRIFDLVHPFQFGTYGSGLGLD